MATWSDLASLGIPDTTSAGEAGLHLCETFHSQSTVRPDWANAGAVANSAIKSALRINVPLDVIEET